VLLVPVFVAFLLWLAFRFAMTVILAIEELWRRSRARKRAPD